MIHVYSSDMQGAPALPTLPGRLSMFLMPAL